MLTANLVGILSLMTRRALVIFKLQQLTLVQTKKKHNPLLLLQPFLPCIHHKVSIPLKDITHLKVMPPNQVTLHNQVIIPLNKDMPPKATLNKVLPLNRAMPLNQVTLRNLHNNNLPNNNPLNNNPLNNNPNLLNQPHNLDMRPSLDSHHNLDLHHKCMVNHPKFTANNLLLAHFTLNNPTNERN